LEKKAEQLQSENETLEAELAETKAATEELEREAAESRASEAKRRSEELNALKKANQQIKVVASFLRIFLSNTRFLYFTKICVGSIFFI